MIRVIGAGLPRTGTLSLATALDRLGFGPCYHMFELMRHPRRARLWLDALHGRPTWADVLAGYRSAVDWPASFFYADLAAAYPDAKVILTVRDPDRWFDSSQRLLRGSAFRSMVSRPAAALIPFVATMNELMGTISATTFGTDAGTAARGDLDRARAISAFEEHRERVQADVPPERLLVFDVREGWAPLCAFLGVPVPSEPFPRRNEGATFDRDMTRRTLSMFARNTAPAGVAVAGLVLAAFAVRRLRRGSRG